jgi:RND superfamily putative drug exporter
MSRRLSPESLASASARHPVRTLIVWVVALVLGFMASSALLDSALTGDAKLTNSPESVRAQRLLEDRLGADTIGQVLILHSNSMTLDDEAFADRVNAVLDAAPDHDVVATVSPFDDERLVADDGHTVLVQLAFPDVGEVSDHADDLNELIAIAEGDGVAVKPFGFISLDEEISKIIDEDLAKGETIGVVVALIVLVIVFGALVASLLPIMVAIFAIAIALGLAAVIGQAFQLSILVTNIVTMMGLAVGIDYSLFVVSRYREERARGLDKYEAITASGSTASRAVVFSGFTVVIALLGMFIVPHSIFRSLAVGSSLVVILAVLATLTLLPAVLALLGDKIEKGRIRRHVVEGHPFWDRVARAVMRRPVVWLVSGVVVLLLLAVPALGLKTGFSGIDSVPTDTESAQAFRELTKKFEGSLDSPVEVVVDGNVESGEVTAAVDELISRTDDDSALGTARIQVFPKKDLAIVNVATAGNPNAPESLQAVERIRHEYVPEAFAGVDASVLVGGEPAFSRDAVETTNRYTPIAILFVLALSFVLLMIVFRSIVVPIKALLLNLLSVAAAYGVVVAVSQNGWGAGVLGFRQVEVLETWLPLFLFSILFGLSMDYHVFLLSRIREHYDETHDNTDSVAFGVRNTGRIITGAALIMVAVFGGFALGRMADLQQVGLGLAVAVLLDATIVRAILVPASMRLLGDKNWYLPPWLEWLPRIGIEGPVQKVDEPPAPDDERELVGSR